MIQIRKHLSLVAVILLSLVMVSVTTLVVRAYETPAHSCKVASDAFCYVPKLSTQLEPLDGVTMPKLATPGWLASQSPPPAAREVTYTVQTRGTVTADVNEFKTQVAETLNSPLGWTRLGVRFTQVESGGQFTVWLSEASQVPSFSPSGCDTEVSCTVGNNVIINQTRWVNGSDAWNGAGGDLRNYRNMVVNHETGHWLGHGHESCSAAGQPAAVMQQQTINMQGCTPNPWPLQHELYSPKLGIRS